MYFYDLKLGPLVQSYLGSFVPTNLVKNHVMLHTKLQVFEPSDSEKDFRIFFYVFLWFNLGPYGEDLLRPLGLLLNKFG